MIVRFDEGDDQLCSSSSQFPSPLYVKVQGVYRTEFTVLCKFGKRNSLVPLAGLDCLTRAVGRPTTPSGVFL